jgi:cell division transport system ATP-binding protein
MDLVFKSVTKNYGLITALKDVTFKVNKGDFVLLTGPSGSGKTTIFKIILGEIKPSSGNIIINKNDINSIKKRQMEQIRKQIGVIFQDYQLVFDKTVEENINLALDIVQADKTDRLSKVERVLKTVGLLGRRYLFPSQLSGGELQRTALARALVVEPQMILADEPMGNLDEINALNLIELFKKINQDSQTPSLKHI